MKQAILSRSALLFGLVLLAAPPLAQAATSTTAIAPRAARATLHPRLSANSARKIALARVPNGRIKSEELEREHGRQIWSFDIVVAGKAGIDEVNVDAHTGAVVAVQHEGPREELKEKLLEKSGARTHR